MTTENIYPASVLKQPTHFSVDLNLVKRFNAFADSQKNWAMAYWIGSLMVIGSLLLPVTFLMTYALGGPVVTFLALGMISFFASMIANMSGMGIRACIYTFLFSTILHLSMMLITVLNYYMQ